MSVSTKELFTAFFKGLAFAKGLNFGEKNRDMAEDRWITIHPFGNMKQGEADTGEGKGYYRRIEIDDDGTILKGFGNKIIGTNLKDLSANIKAVKNGEQPIKMDKEGHPYVAHLDSGTKEGKSKNDEGKKEPESKKTEEKSAEKKPETEKKAETKTEKKIKVRVGNMDYEFTREEAEKQLKYDEKYIPESEKELKEFTEKKKTIDKERETVEPLDKFYSDYKKALDKFDDDSYLAAASYFNKYKDRFGYLKGQALKTVKNDTRLDHNKTEQRQKEYSEKAKDLFRQSSLLRDQIESSKNDIKQRTDVSNSLRKALAQDSLDLFINNVNIER